MAVKGCGSEGMWQLGGEGVWQLGGGYGWGAVEKGCGRGEGMWQCS